MVRQVRSAGHKRVAWETVTVLSVTKQAAHHRLASRVATWEAADPLPPACR